MYNNTRSVFTLDGLMGLVAAVVVLLGVLVVLVALAINVQNENASNYYEVKNEKQIGSGIMGKNTSLASDHIADVK